MNEEELTVARPGGLAGLSDPDQALRVMRLNGKDEELGIQIPKKEGDVGYDLVVSETTYVIPTVQNGGMAKIVPCAVRTKIPRGMFCMIMGRSSSANKKGLLIHTAVIDNGYTGQMFACVFNLGEHMKVVEKGERLAQVVFFKAFVPPLVEVDELPGTARGETGFGSTGK